MGVEFAAGAVAVAAVAAGAASRKTRLVGVVEDSFSWLTEARSSTKSRGRADAADVVAEAPAVVFVGTFAAPKASSGRSTVCESRYTTLSTRTFLRADAELRVSSKSGKIG